MNKKILIHVGRPDEAKPHRDLSVLQAFIKVNPDYAVVILVDTDKDHLEIGERVKTDLVWPLGHPGGLIIHWKNDAGMLDMMCQKMFGTVTWKVVGACWYTCVNGHETPPTMMEPLSKCPACGAPLTMVRHNEERVNQFGELLKQAVQLMHFDTRSGVMLNLAVNPDSNVCRNIPLIMGCEHAPGEFLKDFAGKGAGKPCLSISAGPSLDDEIENIKRLQDSHLILCVGRVFKRLRDAGIRVDYTVSCEMFGWDSAIFNDLGDVGQTVLCYPGVVAPETIKKWTGRKVCMMDPALADVLKQSHSMSGGNSVSHHMLNFAAEILGCEPIILVGQDLAYTKPGPTHATGSVPAGWPDDVKAQDVACHAEIEWGPCYGKSGRYNPHSHRQSVVIQGGVVPVGPMEVMTSRPYRNFGTLFEILVARHGKKILNACGEGLVIKGVPYVNLSEVK